MVKKIKIMKYTTKIQRSKSVCLPLKIRKHIESNELNKVEWVLDNNENTVQITFTKKEETPQDIYSENMTKLYRNIYQSAIIKIPNTVFNQLKCQIFDNILLEEKDNTIFITTSKKTEIAEISALIKKSGDE